MKNYKLNLKSIVQSKARWLLTLIAILSLGVGQMWGDDYLKGSWDGWSAGLTFSNGFAFLTVDKGTYSFKIIESGSWTGGTGPVTRASNSATLSSSGNGDNISFTADVDGTYLFKWNDRNMEVIYPATFSEDAVLFFTMETSNDGGNWWNNANECYHYAKFKGTGSTSDATVHLYNVSSTSSSKSGGETYFATIPAGSYSYVSFYRGKSAATLTEYYNEASNVIIVNQAKNKFGTIYNSSFGSWQGWSNHTQPTSTGSVSASNTAPAVGVGVTLTPSLTSNTEFNKIKSVAYTVSTGTSGTHWTIDGNTFTPLVAGSYTVTATITYNLKGWTSTTKTVTPTVTITGRNIKSLTTEAGTGITDVTGSTDDISAGQNISISATVKDGYTWSTWTKTGEGTLSTYTAGTKNQTVTVGTLGNITLTASATENMTTVNLIASPTGAGTFTSNASTVTSVSAGVDTKPTVTAVPTNGYYLNTSSTIWTKGNNNISLSATNTASTKITGCGTAATSTDLTATFTKKWYVKGDWSTWDETTPLTFTSATSAYVDIDLTKDDAEAFKIWDKENNIYFTHEGGYNLYRAYNSPTPTYEGGSDNNMVINPDITGQYRFTVTFSSVTGKPTALTVTYPTTYTLTFGASPSAAADAPTNNKSITSGSLVLSGTEITFTKDATPNSGYTWKGWYDNEEGDGDALGTGNTYTTTISAATTVYAVYTEDMHDVTVNAQTGGTVSYDGGAAGSSCTARAGIATASANIVATASTGYYFVGWQLPDGTITKASESAYNGATSTYTINATADSKTVTALFNVRYALLGSPDPDNGTGESEGGMPGWGESNEAPFAYSDDTYTKTVTLTKPNATYKFRIVDRRGATHTSYGLSSKSVIAADGNYHDVASTANDAQLATAGVGTYTLYVQTNGSGKPQVKIANPASHLITMGTTTFFNSGASSATATSSTAGGNVRAEDGEDTPNPIVNGNYIKDEGTITFTADPEDGYTFEGWYSNSACSSAITHNGTTIVVNDEDKTLTLSSIGAAKTVYAKFSEVMTTVNLSATNGKIQYWTGSAWADAPSSKSVGVHTTCSLKVVPNPGYYFSGWTRSATPDFHLNGYAEANTNVTLTGDGAGTTGTLTANFTELDKIYFRNLETMDGGAWANVYVYFGVTWNGYANAVTNASASYKATMTQIGETDVYWAYVPRAFTTSGGTAIAFADYSVGTSATINTAGKLAASRNDYNRALQMYVPSVTWDDHGAHYYNSGYWKNYPVKAATGAGYYLQTERGTNLVEFTGQADNSDIIECTVRVDQHDEDKTFHIKSAGGIYFEQYDYDKEEYPKITSTASTMTMKGDDSDGLIVTLTSEGDYKFILDQSSDVMVLTVVYPVGVGDYRLKHTYTDGSAKTTYSDVIKSLTAGESATYSMFLSTKGSETLVLQKCTGINAGTKQPEWTVGDATNLDVVLTKVRTDGDGVYQFDLTVNTSTHQVSAVENIGKYTGPFYIKTDCSPGRWADYTRNVMETNTITADQFDYYYVTNAGSGSNVKFVIANLYNNAISDTIKGDATYLNGGNNEHMPSDGCVRFMYKSATNTASRAYMKYSNNNDFLNVKPTAASKVYLEEGGSTDLYSASDANTKIGEDDGNYVYRKTVYAVPGAVANIQAMFNGNTQTFVASRTLMGGTGEDKYPITLVYDFKTNYLMAAWQPSETPITAALENVEFMYIREGQETSNQISFDGSGRFTNPKVYGVFKFDQEDYKNRVGAWPRQDGQVDGYTYKMCMFYFSFPFDVKVNDIYGVGTYGTEWKIQYYDGAERASKGFFRGDGTTTFWKDMPLDGELKAYVGYSLLLDNDYFNGTIGGVWAQDPASVYLYFPSKESISNVSHGSIEITVPAHECTIDRTFDNGSGTMVSHRNTDSHWNMVGVPLFKDQTGDFTSIFTQSGLSYLYAWNPVTNTLGVADAVSNFTFKAMYAYMVQYAGNITFTGSRIPSSVAARRATQEGNYKMELSVLDNENEFLNRTYVELREEASEDFMLNEDVYMALNSRDVNIYSFAGDYDVAANVLPMSNQTVRLGLNVKKNGTYKLSMPSNFNGTATLIDTETNQRTNLGFGDYEVYLTKGNYNNRFILDVNIYKTPTAIDGVDGGSLKDGKAHKFIENGQMYILRDGRIYDATGAMVK